MIASYYTSRI